MHAHLDELLNLRARLRALPSVPDADRDAWPEIQARIVRSERSAQRRARVSGFATAASVAALGLFATIRLLESPVAPVTPAGPVAAPAAADALAELRSRSQMLEAVLAEMPARPAVGRAATSVPIESLEARVQWLDHEILVADAQARAPDAEQLWRDRVEVMNSLVQLRYVEAQRDLL
jgi:hypothetical protein